MSESQSKGENDFKTEAKFKQFSSAVEKALKTFEGLTEWHDLISSLSKMNKVLLAYMQYPVVPLQLTVCKRLTQCLHPNLPSGVHLKTLDVYATIFDRIGKKGLVLHLLLYGSGLFPLLSYASMSVRARLLDIYEKYFLPLGLELMPSLHGFLLGVLPGLEDESEHTERVCGLLDSLSNVTDKSAFFCALWQCILGSPDYRLPAVNFLFAKLNKKVSAEDQVHCVGGNLPLVVSGMCAALVDKNVLVQRTALDIVSILFPFNQPFLLPADLTTILTAALETLLKRDISLSRRLYAWILGLNVQKNSVVNSRHVPSDPVSPIETDNGSSNSHMLSAINLSYFEKYSKSYLISALKGILNQTTKGAKQNLSKVECVLPYRLLRALLDRSEIMESVMGSIMFDLIVCLRDQINALGGISSIQGKDGMLMRSKSPLGDGYSKKSLKKGSLKADVLQSANLLFGNLSPEFTWKWMEKMLQDYLSTDVRVRSRTPSLSNGTEKCIDGGGEKSERKMLSPVGGGDILLDSDSTVASSQGVSLERSQSVEQVASGSGNGDSLNLITLLGLLGFFVQVLPKDSVASTHLQCTSQLLLQLITLLKSHQPHLSLKELNICHELCLYLLNSLLTLPSSSSSQPPSLITTPSSPSTPVKPSSSTTSSSTVGRSLSFLTPSYKTQHSTQEADLTLLSDEMKLKISGEFFTFFAGFLNDRIIPDRAHHKGTLKDLHQVFSSCCQMLLLVTRLASSNCEAINSVEGKDLEGSVSSPPAWLCSLMAASQKDCSGKHGFTLTALETLLCLVEMASHSEGLSPSECGVHPVGVCIVTTDMVDKVILTQSFVESVTGLLWNLLSFDHLWLHVQVVSLLARLHSLLTHHNACEMVILEQFATQGLAAYQHFIVLWQHMPSVYHRMRIKPFYRALLRMLEGLQNSDVAVKSLTQSWVKAVIARCQNEGVHRLLQPLVKILLESDAKRKQQPDKTLMAKKIGLSRRDAEKDMKYANYYFESMGMVNPYAPSRKDQYADVLLHYTQVFDASQILYALSLLQNVVSVEPSSVVSTIGNTIIDVSMYGSGMHHTYERNKHVDSPETPTTPVSPSAATQKSLLEVILSVCVDLLRSEYHPSLKVAPEDQIENMRVKVSSTYLLSLLLNKLLKTLARHNEPDETGPSYKDFKICSPNFVSALITLCDIQKVCLLFLGKSIEWWCDASLTDHNRKGSIWTDIARQCQSSGIIDPRVVLKSFTSQLLRVVQCLISLDTQFSQSLPIETNSLTSQSSDLVTIVSGVQINSVTDLPTILSGRATSSQFFFQTFVLQVLSNSSLSSFHDDLLHMFTGTISNLLSQQLMELAPKVIKQLCSNIEQIMGKFSSKKLHESSSKTTGSNIQLCITYFDAMLKIILWCFFGNSHFYSTSEESRMKVADFKLQHRLSNPFFDILRVKQAEDAKENHSPTQKQPSTMAWLLGVFSVQKITSGAECEGSSSDGSLFSRVGVNSQVGQQVLMLLPAVYNAMTDVWNGFHLVSLSSYHLEDTSSTLVDVGGGNTSTIFMDSVENYVPRKRGVAFEDVELLFRHFLCTLAEQEPTTLFSSVSHIWLEWNLDNGSEGSKRVSRRKEAFVDMLHHMKVLPLGMLISRLQFTLSDIAHVEEYESSILRQKYLLHFLYKYISSPRQSSKELSEYRTLVVSFLREYHSQIYNPTPQALIRICHILCMLTSILHVLVCRVAPLDSKTQKKERKELQEVTHKLCETLSMVANIGITHPDYVLISDSDSHDTDGEKEDEVPIHHSIKGNAVDCDGKEIVAQAQRYTDTAEGGHKQVNATNMRLRERSKITEGGDKITEQDRARGSGDKTRSFDDKRESSNSTAELLQPTLQALAVLSNVLAHFIDCVFGSSEKDKVTSLLKAVLFNVWPHLHNHSPEFQQCFTHASKLLASLSGFQVTRKSWRKEIFDLFLAYDLFEMNTVSLREWKVIVDNLMTQDQVTFRDLLARLHSTSTPGVVNIFSSFEQEMLSGSILLKRMAFAIFSGEVDQYIKYLPDIQAKLSEYLKVLRYPSVCCEVMLTFRVLLVRLSPHHLMAFWPAMTSELLSLFSQLESDMQSEVSEPSQSSNTIPKPKVALYLAACKLLDTALALPPDYLPHFQWLQWGFTCQGIYTDSEELVVPRLCRLFKQVGIHRNELKVHYQDVYSTPPFLRSSSISSLKELKPFFDALLHYKISGNQESLLSHWHPALPLALQDVSCNKISQIEDVILQDFLESQYH